MCECAGETASDGERRSAWQRQRHTRLVIDHTIQVGRQRPRTIGESAAAVHEHHVLPAAKGRGCFPTTVERAETPRLAIGTPAQARGTVAAPFNEGLVTTRGFAALHPEFDRPRAIAVERFPGGLIPT